MGNTGGAATHLGLTAAAATLDPTIASVAARTENAIDPAMPRIGDWRRRYPPPVIGLLPNSSGLGTESRLG
jgi:hypothetical protein